MTFINYAAKEINCKIVFHGPIGGGKVDNVQYIHDHADSGRKGKLITLGTEGDRTLFFDFSPKELGNVRGFVTRFHLYTVPTQVFYDASRKLILTGVDGIVFVADSRPDRMKANLDCLQELRQDLQKQDYDLMKIPYVLQLNHRNSPDAVPVEEMKEKLLIKDGPVLQAIATAGIGVFDTLQAIVKLILSDLTKGSDARPPAIAWYIARRFGRRKGRYGRSRYARRFLCC